MSATIAAQPVGADVVYDPDFYRQQYDDVNKLDPAALFHHWIYEGYREGRVCNEEDYFKLLAKMMDFDMNYYIHANNFGAGVGLVQPDSLSKVQNQCRAGNRTNRGQQPNRAVTSQFSSSSPALTIATATYKSAITMFMTSVGGGSGGDDAKSFTYSIINAQTLHAHTVTWNEIIRRLHKASKFDHRYYGNMYDYDVKMVDTREKLFLQWIHEDLYHKKSPNRFTTIEHVRMYINELGKTIEFDWEFVAEKYADMFAAYNALLQKKPVNFSDEVGAFRGFVMYGEKLNVFPNPKQHQAYMADIIALHASCVTELKMPKIRATAPYFAPPFAGANIELKPAKPGVTLKRMAYIFSGRYFSKFAQSHAYAHGIKGKQVTDFITKNVDFSVGATLPDMKNLAVLATESPIGMIIEHEFKRAIRLSESKMLDANSTAMLTTLIYNGFQFMRPLMKKMTKDEYMTFVEDVAVSIVVHVHDAIDITGGDTIDSMALHRDVRFHLDSGKVIKIGKLTRFLLGIIIGMI